MKIVTVLGARPQFIKASVVSAEFAKYPEVTEVVVHTGQHFDANMSDVFFDELDMSRPQYNLGVHGGTHGSMTARMLEGIEKVLLDERPDVMLVYGDTNSTLAGALAAAKLHMPVAHVEAGLRSFNMRMPEEINRILTDRISMWLFTPTDAATRNLQREGMNPKIIHQVGDVMYDCALHHGQRAVARLDGVFKRLGLRRGGYVLATMHRAENTGDTQRLQNIAEAFLDVAADLPVVWPLHPRTKVALESAGLLERLQDGVTLIEPVGYLDMVELEQGAAVIATDSGGVQKEAFFHSVPCVTLRDETEWVELVDAGWNWLSPPRDVAKISGAIRAATKSRGSLITPYGNGSAATQVVEAIFSEGTVGCSI